MSSFDSVTVTPTAPLRSEPRAAQDLSAAGARELLDQARRLVETASAGAELVGRLPDDDVLGLAAAAVALTRAGEALAVAATVEAIDRGVVADSVNPDTTQWVRALGVGIEPQQARRIAEVAEKIAARAGLVRQGPPLTAIAADSVGHCDDGGPVAQLVEADPSGRLLLAHAVATGAVNLRAAHRALKEAPRVEGD